MKEEQTMHSSNYPEKTISHVQRHICCN